MKVNEQVVFLDHEENQRQGIIESINETTAQIGSSKKLFIIPVTSILYSYDEVEKEMLDCYHASKLLEIREHLDSNTKSDIEKLCLIKQLLIRVGN